MRAREREERANKSFSSLCGSVGGDSSSDDAAAKRNTCFDDVGSLSNLFCLSSFATFLSSASFSKCVVRFTIDPANVEKVELGGSFDDEVATDVGGGIDLGRINFSWISVSNCDVRQEVGIMVMVASIFCLAAAQRKERRVWHKESAVGVVSPSSLAESNDEMVERHSRRGALGEDD